MGSAIKMSLRKLFRKSKSSHQMANNLKVHVTPKNEDDPDGKAEHDDLVRRARSGSQIQSGSPEAEKHHVLMKKLSKFDLIKHGGKNGSQKRIERKISRCNVKGTSLALHTEHEHKLACRSMSQHASFSHKRECEPVQRPEHVRMLQADDAIDIKAAWDECCGPHETMNYDQFLTALRVLSEHHCADIQTPFTQSLFELFKVNETDEMIESEFDEGIALLCVGNAEEKQLLTFQVFDTDLNGYIDMREMYSVCKIAFKAALDYALDHYAGDQQCFNQLMTVQENSVCIVRNYVASVFAKYSHHTDHRLRYGEFLNWMAEDPEFTLQVDSNSDHETHCVWLSMTHSACGHHHKDEQNFNNQIAADNNI